MHSPAAVDERKKKKKKSIEKRDSLTPIFPYYSPYIRQLSASLEL
jgi:hypothetical protein